MHLTFGSSLKQNTRWNCRFVMNKALLNSKGKNDVSVQGTNDSSILSKQSMSALGYFDDPFVQHFTSRAVSRRAPLINRGYYIRSKVISECLNSFLESNTEKKQIISLGAGFDTAYFRFAHVEGLRYFEVDFPDVINRKRNLMKNYEVLTRRLEEHTGKSECHFLGVDLKNIPELEKQLLQRNILPELPTLVLSECVMTYMEVSDANEVISWAAQFLKNAHFVTYEQICPSDGFGLFMQRHFIKLNSKLKGINTFPDKSSQCERYRNLGWDDADCWTMHEFYESLADSEKERIDSLEPFDEFEEWKLKCQHYVVVFARTNVETLTMFSDLNASNFVKVSMRNGAIADIGRHNSSILRFGHAVCAIGQSDSLSKMFLVTGGFGINESGKHARLLDCSALTLKENCLHIKPTVVSLTEGRLYHTCTKLTDNSVFIYGGRTSPTREAALSLIVTLKSDKDGNDLGFSMETVKQPVSNHIDLPLRWRHTANLVCENTVLIFGGRNSHEKALGDSFLLNVKANVATQVVDGASPSPRHSHAAVSIGTSVFIHGGLDEHEHVLKDLHMYNHTEQKWERKCADGDLPALFGHSLHVLNDHTLLLFGGVSRQSPAPNLYTVDLNSSTVTGIYLPQHHVDNDAVLMHHNIATFICDNTLYMVGGGGNCFSFGTHFNDHIYTVDLNKLDI